MNKYRYQLGILGRRIVGTRSDSSGESSNWSLKCDASCGLFLNRTSRAPNPPTDGGLPLNGCARHAARPLEKLGLDTSTLDGLITVYGT